MRIKALNQGMTVEIAQACSGFELLVPESFPFIASPSEDLLQILRTQVDPRGVFTTLPSA